MALLELSHVEKHYGQGKQRTTVLRNVDLKIEAGEFVAIVGHSGAGKTTLVSLIAGLMQPDSGSVRFNGQTVQAPGPERAIVFQNYSLLPWLSVLGNVQLAVDAVYSAWSAERRREHARRYVALVGLAPASEKKPAQLSGGMRQRVALARAMAMEPNLLLLDEPLSALDALTRATLQRELARLCHESGKTILLITNDVDESILLADRVIPFQRGGTSSLGMSIGVELARPRDRKALNFDPRFREIRAQVIESLLAGVPARPPRVKLASDPTPLFGNLEVAR